MKVSKVGLESYRGSLKQSPRKEKRMYLEREKWTSYNSWASKLILHNEQELPDGYAYVSCSFSVWNLRSACFTRLIKRISDNAIVQGFITKTGTLAIWVPPMDKETFDFSFNLALKWARKRGEC
jgi:hypothetical protein